MPKGAARARSLLLLAVLFTVILGTSGRAQNPNSQFPFASGGGYACDPVACIPGVTGFVHFAFSAMPGPSGTSTARGYGRFDFRDGTSDQGNVVCFIADSPTQARFTISVTKGPDRYLLVEVMDNGNGTVSIPVDLLGYTRSQVYQDCTTEHATTNPPS